MLNKHQSKKWLQLKLLLVLPALGMFIMSFNTKTVYVEKPAKVEGIKKTPSVEIIVTNDSDTPRLNAIHRHLKAQGINMHIKTINRNADNLISSIDVDFKTINGSTNYHVEDHNGIKPFFFTMKEDGSFEVGTIPHHLQLKDLEHLQNINDNEVVHKTGSVKITEYQEESLEQDDKTDEHHKAISKPLTTTSYNYKYHNSSGKNEATVVNTNTIVLGRYMYQADAFDVKLQGKNDVILKDEDINVIIDDRFSTSNTFEVKRYPLVILNGNDLGNTPIYNLDYSAVSDLNVLKGEQATKVYGQRGKDGVVVINTGYKIEKLPVAAKVKVADTKKHNIQLATGSNTTNWVGTNEKDTPKTLAYITKLTSDVELNQQIEALNALGLEVKISKLKRNRHNKITKIKVSVRDLKGNNSTATFTNDKGIDTITYGKSNNFVVVSSIH